MTEFAKTSRVKETKKMNCGMDATIIKRRSTTDIDIRFADGAIRKHVSYSHFNAGSIAHPNHIRIGKPKMMKCGYMATVIGGRNRQDVDVEFEDGTVRYGVSMASFYQGTVPYVTRAEKLANERLYERGRTSSGEVAIIVDYRNSHDFDVCIGGGYMKNCKSYAHFKSNKFSMRGAMRVDLSASPSVLEPKEVASNKTYTSNMRFVSYGSAKEAVTQQPVNVDIHVHGGNGLAPISKNEFILSYYMRTINFEKSKKGELKNEGFGQFELDLYNKELKIAIEYDGCHHGMKGALERDLRKNQCCKNAGVKIIRVRESNLDDIDDGISINIKLTSKPGETFTKDLEDAIRMIYKECGLPAPDINFERDGDAILAAYKNKLESMMLK
jgi:very-short-patch-repair endonuclease